MSTPSSSRRRLTAALALAGLIAPLSQPVLAERAARQQVRLVVPFPPGGGTDAVGRMLAAKLAETTGDTVVVDNRAGASGTIGIDAATKMQPNGNNFVLGQADNLAVAPILIKAVPYDAQKDLVPVAHVADVPLVLVTAVEQPYQTLQDLIDAAKADPLLVTFGSAGVGTTPHLSGELFAKAAGIEMNHISYKGSAPALTDVLAGRVTLMVSSISSAAPHIRSGRLRALAVSGGERSRALPDVPTVAEAANLPGFDVGTWYAVFAPVGTPPEAVAQMNADVNEVLALPEMIAFLESQEGARIRRTTPEALAELLSADIPRWNQVITDANVSLE